MDTFFLSQRLLTIARYRHSFILFKKERLYYYRYMIKLSYNLEYLGAKNIEEALRFVKKFRAGQAKRIRDGFFIKPRKALFLACMDAEDVLQSMKRYEGVGEENWNCFGNEWKVNFEEELEKCRKS